MTFSIKKGDRVAVISGKDRGKQQKVLKVFPREGRILVEGVNLHKKHQRPRTRGAKGEVITLPSPIHVSNVMLVCTSCAKPARLGSRVVRTNAGKTIKERLCKKCGALIA